MHPRARRLLASIGFVWLTAGSVPAAAQVEALFDLRTTASGPFPTNVFTKLDRRNLSDRVVNLPRPDCTAMAARCAELDVLNSLDGFNLQPRLRIPFSGAIDVSTVNTGNFFLVNLGDTDARRDRHRGEIIGVNQIVFDPETNTLAAEPDVLLRQHTRYALIATKGIKDPSGRSVRGSALARFLADRRMARKANLDGYRVQLLLALAKLRFFDITEDRVVSASIFTTQSNTAILEKMRRELRRTPRPVASFATGMGGETAVFELPAVQSVTFQRQVGTAPRFGNQTVQIAAFGVIPGSVGAIAFGTYPSPTFLTPQVVIPAVGTRTGRPAIQGTNTISFFLVLPAGPRPAAGWPVALVGHGFGGEKGNLIAVSSVLASQGIATVAINVVGHGGGSAGTMTVTRTDGTQVVVLSGGRGIDQNGDGNIDGTEGFSAGGLIGSRDALRQTVSDLMQLIRTFRSGGVDVDGDGAGDFDPARVFYTGVSLGGIYGTMLLGVEPNVRAGVPNVPGGVLTEIARLSQAFRASFVPGFGAAGLLNVTPVAPPLFGFNENIPLRNLPPLVNAVPGAAAVAEAIDNLEWVAIAGDPLGYARHVRAEPLAGNRPKPLIFQFARGDMTVPNPTSAALVRAGEFQDRVTFFRNDLFVQQQQAAGASVAVLNGLRNPHGFIGSIVGVRAPTALAAQMQIAMFFASNGTVTVDPDGAGPLFETPIGTLPEDLGFLPPFTAMTPMP
jgi:dienelactone hydrolase